MNIALIGYGKMGKTVERVAESRGHNITARITSANSDLLAFNGVPVPDVAIEFTSPQVAPELVKQCLAMGWPVISGTTGWNEDLEILKQTMPIYDAALLHASNFSIGVNLFFELNEAMARLMSGQVAYQAEIEETHHIHKKDAPSGTAITLAQQILAAHKTLKTWSLNFTGNVEILPVIAHRVDDVPGTHIVRYASEIDTIELKHTAHNRDGFAMGAVLAAEFIAARKGVFTMKDVLGLGQGNS